MSEVTAFSIADALTPLATVTSLFLLARSAFAVPFDLVIELSSWPIFEQEGGPSSS